MAAITFDTLKFVERLKAAGVPEAEAEALVEAFGTADLATTRDVERMEGKMEARFERVDGDLKRVKWMLALVVASEVVPLLARVFH